jgi:hypothetical protein
VSPDTIRLAFGTRKTLFRVSVATTVKPGDYRIRWKTTGDNSPATYSPMEDITVTVVDKGESKALVMIDRLPKEIP